MGSGETTVYGETGGLPPRKYRKRAGNKSGSKAARAFRIAWRSLAIVLALLVIAGGIYLGVIFKQMDDTLDKISADEPAASDDTETKVQPKPKQDPVTILIFGLDTRSATGSLNTDVIMAVTLNPTDKKATLVSIPRDTAMKPTGYKQDKANAFYSIARRYGKDKPGGPEGLVKSMFSEFLDVPVDYLVVINFKTFEDVVDALGGIEVDVDQNMCYIDTVDGTNIRLKKGFQTLNGKEALDFVRYRQSSDKCGDERTRDSGDLERNQRQQRVIRAIVDKTVSLGGVTKVNSLLKAVGDNVQTDIPKDRLTQLITTYATLSSADLETIALQGTWKSPYVHVPDENLNAARAALKARIAGSEAKAGTGETAEGDGPESAFAR
jgi:LCP family protein required for cell wall assembly